MNVSDDELEDEDLPVLSIENLEKDLVSGKVNSIRIEEKTIPSLKEVVAIGDRYNKAVYIEDCTLMEASLGSANVDISINNSVITGRTDLKNGSFGRQLNLSDLIFQEEVDFSRTTFKEDVCLEECVFRKKVNCNEAHFEREAVFTSCDFREEVSFEKASFEGRTDFADSTFRKRATYKSTLFKGEVDFSDSVFEEDVEMEGSNLPDIKNPTT